MLVMHQKAPEARHSIATDAGRIAATQYEKHRLRRQGK
jgi:hypothetical protein